MESASAEIMQWCRGSIVVQASRLHVKMKIMFSTLTTLADAMTVWFTGGVRVRIRTSLTGVEVIARGRTPGIPADKLARLVRELRPEESGTVDVHHDGHGHWRIRVSSALKLDGFDQRVRNVVVNS